MQDIYEEKPSFKSYNGKSTAGKYILFNRFPAQSEYFDVVRIDTQTKKKIEAKASINKAFYQEGYGYSAGKLWSTYTLANGDYTFSCRDSESLNEKDVIYGLSGGLIRNVVYDEKYIFYSNRGNPNLNIYEDESKTVHRINFERFIYKDKLANGTYASSTSSIYKDKDTNYLTYTNINRTVIISFKINEN